MRRRERVRGRERESTVIVCWKRRNNPLSNARIPPLIGLKTLYGPEKDEKNGIKEGGPPFQAPENRCVG